MDESVYELRAANCNIDSGDSMRVSHRGQDEKTDKRSSPVPNIRDLNLNFCLRRVYRKNNLIFFAINYSQFLRCLLTSNY